jgi:hypothetical protein
MLKLERSIAIFTTETIEWEVNLEVNSEKIKQAYMLMSTYKKAGHSIKTETRSF